MTSTTPDAQAQAQPSVQLAAAGAGQAGSGQSQISDEEVAALLEQQSSNAGPKPYDFAAQRINRTDWPLLDVVHKSFAVCAVQSLSNLLARDVAVQFDGLEAVKCGELHPTLPVPGSLAVVRLKPMPGFGFVSVEPALLLALLDGFFGGSGRAARDVNACIAPAAQRFLALIIKSFVADVAHCWSSITAIELELVKQETNCRLVQLGEPLESVLVCRFLVQFGPYSGSMKWLLPEKLLAPIREALQGSATDAALAKPAAQENWAPALSSAVREAQLDTRAVLTEAQISLRELVRLAPGDIIPIAAPEHVTLLAGDVPLYRGRFGVSQGKNALKILSGVHR